MAGGFVENYNVGGDIDSIGEIIDPIKINGMSQCTIPYNKTFKLNVPASPGIYPIVFNLGEHPVLAGKTIELAGYSASLTGYSNDDFIELLVNSQVLEETWYMREIAENITIGGGMSVYQIPVDSIFTVNFNNVSEFSKTLWFKFKMIYNEE